MPSLFISYRRGDSPDSVKLIYDRLKKRLPRWEIFYDHEGIALGEQFPERLCAKVTAATAVLVIVGPKWAEILHERKIAPIDHVREEVRLALETGASVVPILAGRAVMPTDADLADFADLQPLLKRHGRPVRPDPDFESDFEPIVAHLKSLDSAEAVGTILDDKYTLTQYVAEGGMGVVYAAQQKQPVQRMVAIKLIKPGMDSRDVLARFDAERQALAVMDHPNVAKVLDAGMTAHGWPYFVMEYVKGVPITQYCDDKKLNPQERLNLFIPVCNAVQHAHQKGIIHRDLKPSNVLVEVVDGKPVPKVIDFGLAKALGHKLTDKTLHTALEMRVGTLEYSAPEQAAGRSFDVDTRSDIYSLGVLLYELLTGAPPFTHEELLRVGEEEMKRVIREDVPKTPSKKLSSSGELPAIAANRHLEPNKLTRMVKGDLDWIVMKCLEKENARRYETANQLGEELRRFLADEPVQAGPPSASYRAKKFLRRNKGRVSAAALVLLVGIAGIISTSIGFVQANMALEAERKAKATAQKRLEHIEKANELIVSVLSDVFVLTELGPLPVEEVTSRRLEQIADYFDTTMGDATVGNAMALAELQFTLGLIFTSQGKTNRAVDFLTKARITKEHLNVSEVQNTLSYTLHRKYGLEFPQPQYTVHLETLSTIWLKQKKFPECELILRECLETRVKKQRDAWSTFNTKAMLGASLLGQKKYADAEPLLKEGYEGMKKRERQIPPQGMPRLTEALERLVQLYDATGNAAEAERYRKELAASKAAEMAPMK